MRKGPDGAPQIETWRLAADRGSEAARKKLRGPPVPEDMLYLWDWTLELLGRSGSSAYGLAPLSYQTVAYWAVLTHRSPTPREVDVLIRLDTVLREDDDVKDEEPAETPAWPEKKNG